MINFLIGIIVGLAIGEAFYVVNRYIEKKLKKMYICKTDPFDVMIPEDFWEDILLDDYTWEDEDY